MKSREQKVAGMSLNCHCDHCQNNTCTTKEFGLCFGQWSINKDGQLEKKLNCFNQEIPLLQNIICDESITRTSTDITRCCRSKDYCNQADDFLPTLEKAREMLLQSQPRSSQASSSTLSASSSSNSNYLKSHQHPLIAQSSLLMPGNYINSNKTSTGKLLEQYSSLPLEFQIAFIILSSLLLIFGIALAKTFLTQKKRVKRSFRTDVDSSEKSSVEVNVEPSVYDNNSMASREPLIYNPNATNISNRPINMMYQSGSLSHPLPTRGPWMAEESYNGKTQSTFQMSMGSGDTTTRQETSTGSGAGQPYLTQRSIAHDIDLMEVVGRGYFGVVWRGDYKGEPVAVKIFSAMAEPSWERETEIYQTTLLRHKNILGFIASDKREDLSMTGFWLVTDYYPMGSLYDFLHKNSTSIVDTIRMAFSIANGLAHLHVEIFGTQGKPAIAHRDLKSKNILVKNDGTCCIADLGMAVRYNSNTGIVDVPSNTRVGTRRYLAPELLENKLNLMDFEAIKATDVYALGLVLWEILRRTCFVQPSIVDPTENPDSSHSIEQQPSQIIDTSRDALHHSDSPRPPSEATNSNNEHVDDDTPEHFNESIASEDTIDDPNHELAIICDSYEAPYQHLVSLNPTVEEMREIVCIQKIRPHLSGRWSRFAPMRDCSTLMRECWYEKPSARLSALRIRKTLGDIARHYFNMNMEYD